MKQSRKGDINMSWDFDNDRPIYSQIIEHIKKCIVSGEYQAGTKLPAVRELAFEAGVNPNTMQRAFSELENEGLVHANRTSGRFITEDIGMIEKLKKELAGTAVKEFMQSMKNIGFSREEVIELIKKSNFAEGDGNNE